MSARLHLIGLRCRAASAICLRHSCAVLGWLNPVMARKHAKNVDSNLNCDPGVIAFLQQCLQVIQHEECTPVTQVPHQETEASFEGGRHETQRLGCEYLEALIQKRFTGGSIAQGTPDHHFEVWSNLVH